jgi:MFS family permease
MAPTANIMVAISLIIGTPFFIVFGSLSDKIGRKWIILGGCAAGRGDLLPRVPRR